VGPSSGQRGGGVRLKAGRNTRPQGDERLLTNWTRESDKVYNNPRTFWQNTYFLRGQSMTLAELLPAVQQLPAADKIKLIHILAEKLNEGEDISPLVPNKVYELPTPYGTLGAAETLLQALRTADENPT
jgi:hypothetical protein